MKLTWHAAACIRRWYAHGTSVATLAREFDVDEHTIYAILHNTRWIDDRYVPTPPQPSKMVYQRRNAIEREVRFSRRKMQEAIDARCFALADQWVSRIHLLELQSDSPIADIERTTA